MVIQSNMSPKSIVLVWESTKEVFNKYNIQLTDKTLESFVNEEVLTLLLAELNEKVGSSSATCIEGG
ncbi:hypothetical protein CU633_03900 [Bacillus sp. V3-13]|uniref:hypothetical protein n=1 Tax=Bacillus sp. V3-13 TaxID=2053728 RepID=UPI000C779085|nr:hypothetical protein [Bacillus sp. V3-13]PLR78705.1 hypothetical protein CU633_03900 [Bacillus sp. V3-13]